MNKIDNNEQWTLNGDCSLCRRQKYCSNPCTKAKRRRAILVQSTIHNAINNITGGAYQRVLDIIND